MDTLLQMNNIILYIAGALLLTFVSGIKIIRLTQRGLIVQLGKYRKFANPRFHWIIPVIDRMFLVNETEQMVDAEPQEIITNDNLNASVDAVMYFKVLGEEENVKKSQYYVNDYKSKIINLSRSTLRNIIGTLTLKSANSERIKINSEFHRILLEETKNWGITISRTELEQIDPPKDVQETMNKVVKTENEKIAAIDYATAAETVADGVKRGNIKENKGVKQSKILHADGESEAIKLLNEAANKFFIGNAQLLKKLAIVEASLKSNAKIVIPTGTELVNIIGEIAGVKTAIPTVTKTESKPQPIGMDIM
jgi:regulator of protease activity HflC (stomatin/prohibitin superfamily)